MTFWAVLLDVDFPPVNFDGNQDFFHLLPLRIVLWLWIGQRFLAALLHLSNLNQGLARLQPEKMIAESSRFGIEPDGFKPVVLRVLHVLAIAPGGAVDEKSHPRHTDLACEVPRLL